MNKNNLLLIVLAVLVLGGGYWYMKSKNTTSMMSGEKEETMMEDGAMSGEDSAELMGMMRVDLSAQPDGAMQQTGTALLEEKDGKVVVKISVEPGSETPQPAHIHTGACPLPGDVVYPLSNVVDGLSETTLDVTMAELREQMPLAINVHKSAAEVKVYTSCGDLK